MEEEGEDIDMMAYLLQMCKQKAADSLEGTFDDELLLLLFLKDNSEQRLQFPSLRPMLSRNGERLLWKITLSAVTCCLDTLCTDKQAF